ncbi:MAG: hypothetical protein DRO09_02395 [Thermoprotei archaeon]|nr:MAG: hypothetical protein DRO09_02395 [Thermoprotei archaeon]
MSSEELKKLKQQRIFISTLLLLLSIAMIALAFSTLSEKQLGQKIGLMFLAISGAMAFFAIYSLYRSLKIKVPVFHIYTVVKCYACGYENRREFKKGDYVHKKEGKCPVCGKETIIDAIYQEVSFK